MTLDDINGKPRRKLKDMSLALDRYLGSQNGQISKHGVLSEAEPNRLDLEFPYTHPLRHECCIDAYALVLLNMIMRSWAGDGGGGGGGLSTCDKAERKVNDAFAWLVGLVHCDQVPEGPCQARAPR